MVSVAVPLALLTSVNAAVRIVPVACAAGAGQAEAQRDARPDDTHRRQAAERLTREGTPAAAVALPDDFGRGGRPGLAGGAIGHPLKFAG